MAIFTIWPPYMTAMVSTTRPIRSRSCVTNSIEKCRRPASGQQQVHTIWDWTETSRLDVGSSQISTDGAVISALAIAIRCLHRLSTRSIAAQLGAGQAHRRQLLGDQGVAARTSPAGSLWIRSGSVTSLDRHPRVERVVGDLQHETDLPAQRAQLAAARRIRRSVKVSWPDVAAQGRACSRCRWSCREICIRRRARGCLRRHGEADAVQGLLDRPGTAS